MATSLNPAVSRVSYPRWFLHLGAHVFGVAAGALVAFLVLASFAAGIEAVAGRELWILAGAAVVALAVARDLGAKTPVPYRDVQVPQVLRYLLRPALLAFTYGAQLGVGFLTRYTYSTHTAVLVALPLVVGDPLLVLGSILAFALGKGVVLLASVGTSTDEGPFSIAGRPRWRINGLRLIKLANAATAATLVVTALHVGGVF
jgi:hypothetical protein